AFDESMNNFRKTLAKTRPRPPAPKGHMEISGIAQIVGENLVVHVDVDATFDPDTCNDYSVQGMKVRWIARTNRAAIERERQRRDAMITAAAAAAAAGQVLPPKKKTTMEEEEEEGVAGVGIEPPRARGGG